MPVTPDDIHGSAVALGEGDREVDWRNAGSRAYFAAFHRCRRLAMQLEPHVDVTRSNAHQVVPDILRAEGGKPRQLAYMLIQCRRVRNLADYDIDDPFRRETGLGAVDASGRVLAMELDDKGVRTSE